MAVEAAGDTTGAGDAFCGAFMSRWLASGPDAQTTDLVGAAEFAARVADRPCTQTVHPAAACLRISTLVTRNGG